MAMRAALLAISLQACQSMIMDWSDCGDKDTHFRVMSLSPLNFEAGKSTTIIATGTAANDIVDGVIQLTAVAGRQQSTLTTVGDICKKTEHDLGDYGNITIHGLDCPAPAGDTVLKIEVHVGNLANDVFKLNVKATTRSGERLACANMWTDTNAVEGALPPGAYKTLFKSYTGKGMDATSQKIDVWFPVGSAGQMFPFISYSHGNTAGGTALPADYGTLLSTMSSYGYIIAAHESCNTGCAKGGTLPFDPPGFATMYKEQLKVIDWAKQLGGAGDTVFKHAKFSLGVGIAGHSMGGQATVYSSSSHGSGHGIKAAVMHHAFTHSYPPPVVPFLAFTGSADIIAWPSQTEGFFNAKGASPIRGRVNKAGATHFEPNPLGGTGAPKNLGMWSAAWFKVYLDETPQSGGVNYKEFIFGKGSDSLCHGGDGTMTKCDVHDGSGSPTILNNIVV